MTRSDPTPRPTAPHEARPEGSPREPVPPAEPHAAPPRADRIAEALALLAFALGLLPFLRLARPSLWLDEAFTWIDAHADGAGGPGNWLGYAIVRRTVEALGQGPSEAALRFAPALAGWLAVAATVWAFRPLAGARRAALAGVVLAASPWHVHWAQTARFYSFVELASVLSAGLLVRGLGRGASAARGAPAARELPRLARLALGLACVALGTLCHPTALLAFGGFVGALVLARPSFELAPAGAPARSRATARDRRLVLPFVAAALVFLAVLGPPGYRAFAAYAHAKGGGGLADVQAAVLALGLTLGPSLGVAAVIGFGTAQVLARGADRRVWFTALVPALIAAAVVALAGAAKVGAQYAFVALPWVALLAAWPVGPRPAPPGVDGDTHAPGAAAVLAWTALLAGPLLAATGLQLGPRHGDRERWREALAFVEARRAPGEAVVSLPGTTAELHLARGHVAVGAPPAVLAAARPTRGSERAGNLDQYSTRTLEPLARAGRGFWVVLRTDYLAIWEDPERARLQEFLRAECRLEARFPVRIDARDLDLEVWRRRTE